jgi:hypothetical protein
VGYLFIGVLALWREERPPKRRVDANILNKQSRTADKGWFSSLGVVGSANDYSRKGITMLRAADKVLNLD